MSKKTNAPSFPVLPVVMTTLGYFLLSRYGSAVTKLDLVFPVAFIAYVYIANAVCFDSNKLQMTRLQKDNIAFEPMGKHSLGKGKFKSDKSFLAYVGVAKVVSFLMPLALIVAGPPSIAALATPSVLQVIGQLIAELSTATCHDVLRILVPIAFMTHRLFGPVSAWALDSQILYSQNQEDGTAFWCTFNLVTAWANVIFTAWNLFGFLLLRVLPVYFDKEDTLTGEFAYTLLPLPKKNKKSL